jgi:predicted oxidoreductase
VKSIVLGNSDLVSSRLVYGCMRISGDNSRADRDAGKAAIRAAIEAGYTHFDHADIYGGGNSEAIFAEVLDETPGLREKLLITSKCGIRLPDQPSEGFPKRYDFSRNYIVSSVEGSLQRLGTDYLDLLLLHRPDFLFDAEELAGTFRILMDSGKVANFGVSNFSPSQFSLLQYFCDQKLLVNQIEINIDNLSAITNGTLDQCQQLKVTPMAWCPLGGVVYPAWCATLSDVQSARIQAELQRQSARYAAEPWIVFLAWLLKHPAGIAPIIGSTRPSRISAALQSLELQYTAEDWYRLLEARNGYEVA